MTTSRSTCPLDHGNGAWPIIPHAHVRPSSQRWLRRNDRCVLASRMALGHGTHTSVAKGEDKAGAFSRRRTRARAPSRRQITSHGDVFGLLASRATQRRRRMLAHAQRSCLSTTCMMHAARAHSAALREDVERCRASHGEEGGAA